MKNRGIKKIMSTGGISHPPFIKDKKMKKKVIGTEPP